MALGILSTTTSSLAFGILPQAGSGGTETETTVSGVKYAVHTFTSTGNTNFVLSRQVTGLQVLMVAGGGGGGGGNNENQAFGGSGGSGGQAQGGPGGGQNGGGTNGAAIRRTSGFSVSINNSGTVSGNTSATGTS